MFVNWVIVSKCVAHLVSVLNGAFRNNVFLG